MDSPNQQPTADQLTQRELDILRLITDGLSNQDVARRLFITLSTVKWYLRQIYSKLGVSSRTQAIAAGRASGVLDVRAGRIASVASRHNLPSHATPFVGRTDELAAIAEQLADPACRLLTLVGPGGMGKTRLALQAAREQAARFPHGAHFVTLAPVNSADLLIFAIGGALDFSFYGQGIPVAQLIDYLHEKTLLLVLDNFEHLLDGAPLLVDLLDGAPRLKLLVTSRERLNLQEEWVMPIEGMDYPHAAEDESLENYAAVRLFVQRARRVRASFSLSQEQAGVLRICQLVEGMPLGIELAAAWVRLLSCAEIAEQLESGLDLLASPMRDAPERHRSLRAVFDHSWGLLSDVEKTVLAQLSVFRGGFDLEAADRVAGASLPVLASLLDKSLIRSSGRGRHDLHELLRQYAHDKIVTSGDAANTANRHLTYFLTLAERFEAELDGPQQSDLLDQLELELDNLRAALAWSLASEDAETGLRLAGTLGWFWPLRNLSEGRHWYAVLLAANDDALTAVRSKALQHAANVEAWFRNYTYARTLSEQAYQLARAVGDKSQIAWSLATLGFVGLGPMPDYVVGGALLEEALALFRETGDRWGMGHALRRLGYTLLRRKDFDVERAIVLGEEALALARASGTKSAIADSLAMLSQAEAYRGVDVTRVVALAQESLSMSRQIRSYLTLALALCWLGSLALYKEDIRAAHTYMEEYLTLVQQIDVKPALFIVLFIVGVLAFRQGQHAQAATLLAAAEAQTEVGRTYFGFEYDRQFAAARAPLDGAEYAEAWAAGRAMPIDQAVILALEVCSRKA